jgi:hypothetical protein
MTKRQREDENDSACKTLQRHWDKEGLPAGGAWSCVAEGPLVRWETKTWTNNVSIARLEQMLQAEHKNVASVCLRFGAGIDFGFASSESQSSPRLECAVTAMRRLPILKLVQVLDKKGTQVPMADWSKLEDMACLLGKLQGSATSSKLAVSWSILSTKMYALHCTGAVSMPIEGLRLLLRTYRADIDDIWLTANGFDVHVVAEAERRPLHFWASFGIHATERILFDPPPAAKRAKTEVTVALEGLRALATPEQ